MWGQREQQNGSRASISMLSSSQSHNRVAKSVMILCKISRHDVFQFFGLQDAHINEVIPPLALSSSLNFLFSASLVPISATFFCAVLIFFSSPDKQIRMWRKMSVGVDRASRKKKSSRMLRSSVFNSFELLMLHVGWINHFVIFPSGWWRSNGRRIKFKIDDI